MATHLTRSAEREIEIERDKRERENDKFKIS